MQCRRCHGLVVVDAFIDMYDGGGLRWLQAWHCVNCGNVTEPGVAHRRRLGRSLWSWLMFRLQNARSRKTEPVPLGT
jgi:hypothetical protein